MTKFRIDNFIGYRYRRYAFMVFAAAGLWPFSAAQIYFAYPGWESALVSIAFALGLSIPLAWLGGFLLHRANQEFEKYEQETMAPLLGVVFPRNES
jgi:hypothetical protein